ncbi:MAG TPA: hypothetical protein VES36_07080 [Candidatus Limnocylindrales bacterium]|nr:hypothetical protein [Candidatus Limnocylindrales bacterium]
MRPPRALVMLALVGLLLAATAGPSAAQDDPADAAPATGLRVALDRILAEHAFLIIEVMRTGLVSGAEYDAAAETLNQNTNDLVTAISGIYGDAAGDAVDEQWRNHIAFIVDYTRALGDNDSAAAILADGQLEQYAADFSSLLAGAINLPEDVVLGLISEHVDQLKQVASFAAADFGDAYPDIRDTYDHMFMIGDGLASGIISQFPDKFSGRKFAFSPAIDLRITLDTLLGEHTQLATLAMRAALADAPDLPAAKAALNENSDELEAAIGSIYGDAAGAAFAEHWRHHTSLYLAYVAATKDGDEAGRQAALDDLRTYQSDFTAFLSDANPFLPADNFQSLVREHTDFLVAQADSYDEGDFAAAYATQREAWAQIGTLSAGLAEAIADQFPDVFPDTAMRIETPARWWPAVLLLGLLAVLVAMRLVTGLRASAADRHGSARSPRA